MTDLEKATIMVGSEKAIQAFREYVDCESKRIFTTDDANDIFYHELAIKALKKKLEREQGCEYCNNSVETGSCDSNAKMRVEKGDIHCLPYIVVENDTFGTSDIFDVDYCPNCGKKLKEYN